MIDRREAVLDNLRRAYKLLDKAIEIDISDEEPLFIPNNEYHQLTNLRYKLVMLFLWLEAINYPRR